MFNGLGQSGAGFTVRTRGIVPSPQINGRANTFWVETTGPTHARAVYANSLCQLLAPAIGLRYLAPCGLSDEVGEPDLVAPPFVTLLSLT